VLNSNYILVTFLISAIKPTELVKKAFENTSTLIEDVENEFKGAWEDIKKAAEIIMYDNFLRFLVIIMAGFG
jgi:hypothetical protein